MSEYQYPGRKGFTEICYNEYNAFAQDNTKPGCRKSQYIIFVGVDEQTLQTDFDKADDKPVWVTGSPLVIPFEYLFLRPAGAREGDLVFDASDLEEIATMAWKCASRG